MSVGHKEVKKFISYTDFVRDENGNLVNKRTKEIVKTTINNQKKQDNKNGKTTNKNQ